MIVTKLMVEAIIINSKQLKTKLGTIYSYSNNLPLGEKVWLLVKNGRIAKLELASNIYTRKPDSRKKDRKKVESEK